MQRIKQTKQDFIVLLSETKETLDEQLALPQVERDAALIAECLETLDYIKGEANLPEGAFAFDSFQFFARNSSPSILCKEGAKEFKPKLTPKRHTPSVSRFFLQKAALTAAIMLLAKADGVAEMPMKRYKSAARCLCPTRRGPRANMRDL